MKLSTKFKEFDLYMHSLIDIHFEKNENEIVELYSLMDCLTGFSAIYPDIESNLIMDEVKTDLFSSIYLSTKGMYRNAFISLRSSLELGIGYLYFLDNNLDYIKWTQNKFSLSWSRLNDENYGVLKTDYLNLFCKSIEFESGFAEVIDKCNSNYKICSEYTHGKYGYMKTNLTTRYEYNELDYTKFINSFKEVVSCLVVLHAIRFNKSINQLKEEHLDEVEDILKSENMKGVISI